MTPPNLSQLLDELYRLDPELQQHEAALIPLIEHLIAERPNVTPDASFVSELRSLLLTRAEELQGAPRRASFLSSLPSMQRLPYALTGALVACLVLIPAMYLGLRGGTFETQETAAPLFSYSVTPTGKRAFGDLSTIPANQGIGLGGASAEKGGGGMGGDAAVGAGGGAPAGESAGAGGGMAMPAEAPAMDRMMVPPVVTNYTYVYEGELPPLSPEVTVLKRQKGSRIPFSSFTRSLNLGLTDLSTFPDANLDNFSLIQDRQFGYMINVSLQEGTVSIAQYWPRWPHPEAACRDEACFRRYRLTPADIPADNVVIGIAQEFLTQHNVDLSLYGEPEVDNTWRKEYERAMQKEGVWVPDYARVIFPQLIDGKPVYEESGMPTGISVSVSVREKRVVDVWGLMSQSYLSSAYDGATADDVRAFLGTIDKLPKDFQPEGGTQVKNVTVKLGTPTLVSTKVYNYTPAGDEQLIVPALLFPIEQVSDDEQFWRTAIVVPLAKELLDQRQQILPVDIPMGVQEGAAG